MEPHRTEISRGVRRSRGGPSRWVLPAAAVVILVAVVGLAAWLNRDGGQTIDTDVADGTTDDGGGTRPLDLDSLAGTTWLLRAGGHGATSPSSRATRSH